MIVLMYTIYIVVQCELCGYKRGVNIAISLTRGPVQSSGKKKKKNDAQTSIKRHFCP